MGSDCAAKGTGQISEGLRSLVEGRARAGVGLVDGAAKLGLSMSELGTEYDKLKKCETMLRFGGGFYCGKVEDVFVINGFYACMREQFSKPGTTIYYYQVEWDAD